MFVLGLKIANFRVLSYTLEEIILEKYRAILTRHEMKERDLFDLFLIHGSLKPSISSVVEKISCSSLIKRDLRALVSAKLDLLKKGEFFSSNENIGDLAIVKYDIAAFWKFKEKIKPILIKICEEFLKK